MIFKPSTMDVHSRIDSAFFFREDLLPQPPFAPPGDGVTPELGVDACAHAGYVCSYCADPCTGRRTGGPQSAHDMLLGVRK